MPKLLFSVAFAIAAATFPSLAQDDGLYAEPPPPGSSFVRVLAAQDDTPNIVTIGSSSMSPGTVGGSVPYQIIPGGTLHVVAGAAETDGMFTPPGFYSVVLHDGIATVIDDSLDENITKATIVFYNFTGSDAIGLSTADGKTPVFASVPAWTSSSIAVNPISIAFGANLDAQVVASTAAIQLERGGAYSVIASGTDTISITVDKNSVAR